MAIPLRKILNQTLADLRLLVVRVRTLLQKSFLEVVALANFVAFLILQLECEVSDHPHEGRQDFVQVRVFILGDA